MRWERIKPVALSWLSGNDWGNFMPYMVIHEDRLVATMVSNGGCIFFSLTRNFMVINRTILWGFLKVSRPLLREHKIIKHKEILIVDLGSYLLNLKQ